jgi:glycosyltransferase involved in cell wall biosynthesis
MKLKILMLPDSLHPSSRSVLEEVFAYILHNKGHEITWVMQSKLKLRKPKVTYWKGTKVYVTIASPGTSRFHRLINNILRCVGKILVIHKIVKTEDFDLVQVRDGLIEGMLALYVKKRYGIPFSFQYSFPFCEGDLYASKSGTGKYPLIYYLRGKLSKPLLKLILFEADLILPISKWMLQDFVEKGIPAEKMMPFPVGINVELVSPNISGTCMREQFKLNNSPTLIYVGTMGKERGLDFLLRALAKAQEKIPGVKLLMVGEGEDRARLEELSKILCIENNVIFTGQVPRSKVPDYIAAANCGVSPIPPLPIFLVSSPTKLIEYMGMGKPVIGNDIPDQKEVITNSGGGICVGYDEREFAEAIIGLLINPKRAEEMGIKGREWVVRNRSYEILADNLEQIYFDLVHSKHPKNQV